MEKPPPTVKGTVTSLSSLIPAEEVNKATKRVQDAIAEKQLEFDRFMGFIADNSSHINLVQKLPHELHHDIMVPFGKAAFFLGRTVHTNELMVFEGENYYADRTAKQTIDILKRRGKALQSQVDSLKANMEDLKAEALFFNTTASESSEGLVEIREDYPEENSTQTGHKSGQLKEDSTIVSETDNKKVEPGDEEFSRIMARLDELEKEEIAAGSDYEDDENATESDMDEEESEKSEATESEDSDEETETTVSDNRKNKNEQNTAVDFEKFNLGSSGHNVRYSGESKPTKLLTAEPKLKDNIPSSSRNLSHGVRNSNPAKKSPLLPEVKQRVEAMPSSRTTVSGQDSTPIHDSSKAFTGSIVEHSHNLQTSTSSQIPSAQPSKPVSRFKMQRK